MTQEQDKLIPIDAPKTKFEEFLRKDNKRIFFSGPFGIGKTYFLKKFFNEWHEDKYDVYHLFPVNYQISSNENIVEFLKYDILVELLKKYPEAFKSKELNGLGEKLKFLVAFCKDRGLVGRVTKTAIKSLFAITPDSVFNPFSRLGRSLKDLSPIRKEFQEFKAEELSGDRNTIDAFLEQIETDADIVATDYVSQLLREKIELLKVDEETKLEKRSVLILDDFDRIDPEHTFRILNVLSAHMDGDEENKFGFDHIIIVGDVANLRSVFRHKYGEKTDFWGYFDKFFTIRPHKFDNEQAIAERIPYLMRLIRYEDEILEWAADTVWHFLGAVLEQALSIGILNLRQLYKPIDHLLPELNHWGYNSYFEVQQRQAVDVGIKLLSTIYGTEDNFLDIIETIKEDSSLSNLPQEKYILYRDIASQMLKCMIPLENPSEALYNEPQNTWLGYTVITKRLSIGDSVGIYPKDRNDFHARFFYETLFEYIKRPEHEKQYLENYRLV